MFILVRSYIFLSYFSVAVPRIYKLAKKVRPSELEIEAPIVYKSKKRKKKNTVSKITKRNFMWLCW